MAQDPNTFRQGRHYLPTAELYETSTKFGNISPAISNNYDVTINFGNANSLRRFINGSCHVFMGNLFSSIKKKNL